MPLRARGVRAMAAASPLSNDSPVELQLARSAVLFLLVLGGPVIAVAALVRGVPGALSAAVGAAVVIGMFLMAGALMSWAARVSPAALMGAVLGGYLVRLMIYAGLIVLLRPVPWLDGPSLAIATAVLLVAVLVWEVRVVSRTPNLFWVNASAGSTGSAAVVQIRNPQGVSPALSSSPNPPVERTRP